MVITTTTKSPTPSPHWAPSPSPSTSPIATTTIDQQSSQPSTKLPVDFSPPLIAMVVVVAAAFLLVTYSRLISRHLLPPLLRFLRRVRRRRRLLPSSAGDIDSPPFPFDFQYSSSSFSPYGLDESVIKTIPLSLYSSNNKTVKNNSNRRECAVCLLEFEDGDYVRTLPVCSHAFHVECIDIWLRSHANCPLCRAGIFGAEFSPFVPLMAARIRPSFDDPILQSISLDTVTETPQSEHQQQDFDTVTEIVPCIDEPSPRRTVASVNSEDRFGGERFLKRSYSFGFERSLASERMVTEPATASPWRYRRGTGGFWSKRPSPFGSLGKPRVFSFRYYRGMKSPFFRRRGSGGGFFPLSESSLRFSSSGGVGSGRRSKSMTSPMFLRPAVAAFSSSRLRCGDPEALLSPERYNRR